MAPGCFTLPFPNVLIPLPLAASRGDQLLNAASFESQGYSIVLQEENLDEDSLMNALHELYENKDTYIKKMEESSQYNAINSIIKLIEENAKPEA